MKAIAQHPTSNIQSTLRSRTTAEDGHPTSNGGSFFVRWRGYGVKFHTNVCGKVYSMVRDEEATRFSDQVEAARVSVQHNLRATDILIENAENLKS